MAFNVAETSGSQDKVLTSIRYQIGVDGANVKVLPAGTSPNVVYRVGDDTVHPEGWDNVLDETYLDFYVSTGATGAQGPKGLDGSDGQSAYYQAQQGGYAGTEEEFYTLLQNAATYFTETETNASEAAASAAAALASETAAGLSEAATAADVLVTNADVLLTNADVVTTNADVVITNADVVTTNADVVLTNADAASTAADVITVTNLYDSFDDRYLGSKASDPTLDNDGEALLEGALYWNSTSKAWKAYDGTSWVAAPATSLSALTDTDLTGLASNDLLQWNGADFVPKSFDEVTPSQATHSGKFLTTDGSNSSWATLPTTASQLIAPTIDSPADTVKATDVTYTVSGLSTTIEGSRKVTLEVGTASVNTISSSEGTPTLVGTTIEVTGVTSASITITYRYTTSGTFSVQAKQDAPSDDNYSESNWSTADSIDVLLSTPALDSPADVEVDTNVVYTISSIDAQCNKIVFDAQASGISTSPAPASSSGSAAIVGNTVEITGFSGTSLTLTLQYDTAATYSNRAKVQDTGATYTDSAYATDSITISAGAVDQTDMVTALYEGTAAVQDIQLPTITTGVDFVWLKSRSSVNNNGIFDTLRGTSQYLFTDGTNAEATAAGVSAFGDSSFTLGTNTTWNASSQTHVAWCVSLPTDTASNTNGTITSVTKNNDFMSAISYTGNATGGATVGHSLASAPELIIVKNRTDIVDWVVYNSTIGNTDYLVLNTTAAKATSLGTWNNTSPTSTVFSLGTNNNTNGSTDGMIAYAFRSVAGKCKVGSYTGNGTTNATTGVGFEPELLMIKNTSNVGDWIMLDNSRGTEAELAANLTTEEASQTDVGFVSFDADGFTVAGTDHSVNTNTDVYIYLAIAKPPVTKTFDVEPYTGNGTTQNIAMTTIDDGVDASLIKGRDAVSDFYFYDSIRGATKHLSTDTTGAEGTCATCLTALNVSSFDVSSNTQHNGNTSTYISWNFSLPTDTASNTDGTITSVTKNNEYMSAVSYTGNLTSNATVGHSLASAPELVIVKNRDAVEHWAVYSATLGAGHALFLSGTNADINDSGYFGTATPTDTVINLGVYATANGSANMIAYAFRSVAGKCKVGTYEGTGASNDVFVGFTPAFVMVKHVDGTGSWTIADIERESTQDDELWADLAYKEGDPDGDGTPNSFNYIDLGTEGFNLPTDNSNTNTNASTYIYLAIAEGV